MSHKVYFNTLRVISQVRTKKQQKQQQKPKQASKQTKKQKNLTKKSPTKKPTCLILLSFPGDLSSSVLHF